MSEYFTLSEKDVEFDNTIRDSIKKSKSKSHMALYLQGQEELNLLRELVQKHQDMSDDLDMLHTIINKHPELVERESCDFCSEQAYSHILDELRGLNNNLNGLIEYICEDGNDEEFESLTKTQIDIINDSNSLVRLNAAKAAKNYSRTLSPEDKRMVELWDYILCVMKFVRNLYD